MGGMFRTAMPSSFSPVCGQGLVLVVVTTLTMVAATSRPLQVKMEIFAALEPCNI